MLLLGAGPRALLLQIAHPRWRPASPSTPTSAPTRGGVSTARCAVTCGSSTARRRLRAPRSGGSTRSTARSSARATPRAIRRCRCGSTPRWSSRRSSPTTPGWSRCSRRPGAAFYEETKPIGRAFGVPEALLPADLAAFEAYLDGAAGAGRPGPGRRHRPRARRGRSSTRRSPARWRGCRLPPAALRLDAVAVDRTAAAGGPRGVRVRLGSARARRRGAGSSPAGVPGARSCRRPSGRCRRRWPPSVGCRAGQRREPASVEPREARPEHRRQVDRRRVVQGSSSVGVVTIP